MTVSLYQKNIWIYFFPSGQGNESYILIGSKRGPDFLSLTMVTVTLAWIFFCEFFFFRLRAWKKINKLFTGLGSVRIVKNCRPCHSFSLYGPPSRQITYIYFRVLLKKSGSRTPRVEVEEMGPSLDLVLRRTHLASNDLMKAATRIPKVVKVCNRQVSWLDTILRHTLAPSKFPLFLHCWTFLGGV